MKGTNSLGIVDSKDLCVQPGLKFPANSSAPILKNMTRKVVFTPISRFIVSPCIVENNDKLMVQTFSQSLIGATIAWFSKIEISKITRWTDHAHLFIEQDKFN